MGHLNVFQCIHCLSNGSSSEAWNQWTHWKTLRWPIASCSLGGCCFRSNQMICETRQKNNQAFWKFWERARERGEWREHTMRLFSSTVLSDVTATLFIFWMSFLLLVPLWRKVHLESRSMSIWVRVRVLGWGRVSQLETSAIQMKCFQNGKSELDLCNHKKSVQPAKFQSRWA